MKAEKKKFLNFTIWMGWVFLAAGNLKANSPYGFGQQAMLSIAGDGNSSNYANFSVVNVRAIYYCG